MLESILGGVRKTTTRIKKVSNNGSWNVCVLTEDGRLYTRGSTNLTGDGTSSSNVEAWRLVDSSVVDFGMYLTGLIYYKADGTWWGTGYFYGFSVNPENAIARKELTSRFSALPSNVTISKFITGYGNTYVLLANGEAWGVGYENNGMLQSSNTTNITIAKKIEVGSATGFPEGAIFKDLDMGVGAGRNVYFLTALGQLYGLGSGTVGQLGSLTSLATNPSAINIATGVSDFKAGDSCIYYVKTNNVIGRGSQKYGQLASNVYTTDHSKFNADPVNVMAATPPPGTQWFIGRNRVWSCVNGVWYYTGYSSYGIGTTTALPNTGTTKVVTPGLENMTGAQIVSLDPNLQTSYAILDGELYGCGYNNAAVNNLPGVIKGNTSNVFVKLDMTGID